MSAAAAESGSAGYDYDIVIGGGGAVAFAMVQQLHGATKADKSALRVLVLESSGKEESCGNEDEHNDAGYNPRWRDNNQIIRDLDKGSVAPGSFLDRLKKDVPDVRDFLTRSRTRCYGGSTSCWGGWIRPLDSYDFDKWAMKRSALDGTSKTDQNPKNYYAEALKLVGLSHFDLFDEPEKWKQYALNSIDVFDKGKLAAAGLQTVVIQDKRKTSVIDFIENTALLPAFKDNVTLVRNATVVDMDYVWDESSGYGIGRITSLTYQGLEPDGRGGFKPGERVKVSARHFVLAMGALEITRFLLYKQHGSPWFGKMYEVGKYYMNHPKYEIVARAWLARDKWQDFVTQKSFYSNLVPTDLDDSYVQAYIVPTEDAVRNGLPFDKDRKVKNFRTVVGWQWDSTKGMWLVNVEINFEQVPYGLSKVTLPNFNDKDVFGIPRMMLDWQFRMEDADTVNNALVMVRQWLGQYDPAVLDRKLKDRWKSLEWTFDWDHPYPPSRDVENRPIYTGDHHMGLCSMNSDESQSDGIVDSNLRVNSSANLWICSTAVYPTGGWANATFTLLAMALRLADHLKEVCK